MTTKQFNTIAANHGAVVEIDRTGEDRAVEVCVVAPDGMQWKDGECIHMMGVYYTYDKGDKEAVYKALADRIAQGLEPLDTVLNP